MIFFLPKTQKASPGEIRPRVAFPQWAAGSEGAEEARQPLTDLGPTVHTLCTLHFALSKCRLYSIHCPLFTHCALWCWGQFLSSYISPLTHHSLFLRIGSDCALSNCLLQNNFVASISVEKNVQLKQSCSKYPALQQCRVGNEWYQKTRKKKETDNCN